MRILPGLLLVPLAIASTPRLWAQPAMSDTELMLRLRAADASCTGAADPTRHSILAALARDLRGVEVDVGSTVISYFGKFDQAEDYEIATCFRTQVCGGTNRAPGVSMAELAAALGLDIPDQLRRGGWYGTDKSYTAVTSQTDYQDRSISYVFFVRNSDLTNLRKGQKAAVKLALTGIEGNRVYGRLLSIKPQTAVLRCANGHEYAPSAGYKFCPVDGLPLK